MECGDGWIFQLQIGWRSVTELSSLNRPFTLKAIAVGRGTMHLGIDVPDSCREDRQLYLWHPELLPHSGDQELRS
jgi:hypothetical protein